MTRLALVAIERSASNVADCVLGLETDGEAINAQMGAIAQPMPVEWYCSLLPYLTMLGTLDQFTGEDMKTWYLPPESIFARRAKGSVVPS